MTDQEIANAIRSKTVELNDLIGEAADQGVEVSMELLDADDHQVVNAARVFKEQDL